MSKFFIPPARTNRQAGSVDQRRLGSTSVGVNCNGDLGDFLVCVLRGLSVGKIEYYGSPGFFSVLNEDIDLLAEEMYLTQNYESRKEPGECEIILGEAFSGFGGQQIVAPSTKNNLEAGVIAGLVGKNLVNYCEEKSVRGGTYVSLEGIPAPYSALVVGAGATGTFAGLQAALSGFQRVDFLDADKVDVTNLNRQILHYDSVGENKTFSLSEKVRRFGVESEGFPEWLVDEAQCKGYDVVFSCVDKKAPRRVLDAAAQKNDFLLVDGGTSFSAGRVMSTYDGPLSDKVDLSGEDQEQAGCVAQANPSIIMPNMIVGSYMVDEALRVLGGLHGRGIRYDGFSNEVFTCSNH